MEDPSEGRQPEAPALGASTLSGALGTPPASSARLVARLISRAQRAHLQAALAEGRLRAIRAEDVLDPAHLGGLAKTSAWLLLGAGVGFAALDAVARVVHQTAPLLGAPASGWRLLALLGANLGAYLVMLPAHEGLHALVILALGGRPRFGVKLPWAAYCTAPDQLFTRRGYLAVALAPLVALSAVGIAVTWLAPNLGAALWFGFVGNVAGAVGDLAVARQIRPLPPETLIADTETGYIAYRADA